MPMIDRLNSAASPQFVDAMKASAANQLAVPQPLFRIMAAAGVTAPGDVDKLSEAQLGKILENRTPEERIALRSKILAAGIYPRTLPVATPVRMAW